jgi:hypothetical protein
LTNRGAAHHKRIWCIRKHHVGIVRIAFYPAVASSSRLDRRVDRQRLGSDLGPGVHRPDHDDDRGRQAPRHGCGLLADAQRAAPRVTGERWLDPVLSGESRRWHVQGMCVPVCVTRCASPSSLHVARAMRRRSLALPSRWRRRSLFASATTRSNRAQRARSGTAHTGAWRCQTCAACRTRRRLRSWTPVTACATSARPIRIAGRARRASPFRRPSAAFRRSGSAWPRRMFAIQTTSRRGARPTA